MPEPRFVTLLEETWLQAQQNLASTGKLLVTALANVAELQGFLAQQRPQEAKEAEKAEPGEPLKFPAKDGNVEK